MDPKFKSTKNSVEIIDPIERHRDQIQISDPITFEYTEHNQIPHPVDSAITITTEVLSLPTKELVYVKDANGSIIAEVRPGERGSFSTGKYILDISVSIKTYVYIEGELEVHFKNGGTHIDLKKPTEITIGVRSYHTQPAGAITTTPAASDVMKAVSTFGSALKTLKPERSYPTLRGHPPTIKIGSQLKIPEELQAPETGIQIEIPEELGYTYIVTPLAYYLGGKVIPGTKPRIITKNNYTYSLKESADFAKSVERSMKHLFFLDCIVRTEGLSPNPLYERQAIESMLEHDIKSLYEQPLAKRVESYLEIPFSVTEPYWSNWNVNSHMQPNKSGINFLPFLAERLLPVRINKCTSTSFSQSAEANTEIANYTDSASEPIIQQVRNYEDSYDMTSVIPLSAFHNNINRDPRENPLDIEVVCNDERMSEEVVAVHSTYGNRKELEFDVNFHHDLSKEDLRELLAQKRDFIHYIGHIDKNGFKCSDGKLDATLLETVKTQVFFLNSCQSYKQGLELVKSGSIGGIVTNSEIDNTNAVKVGRTVARLLNQGYPLYAAIDIIRARCGSSEGYHIVGDGTISIVQSKTGVPNTCSINQSQEEIQISINLYSSNSCEKGGIFIPSINGFDHYYLVPNEIGPVTISKSQLIQFLDIDPIPVLIDNELKWSDNISVSDI